MTDALAPDCGAGWRAEHERRHESDLERLARAASARSAAQPIPRPERRLIAVEAADLLAATFPPRDTLLAPWLQSQSLCMVHAWRGIGKTHFSLGLAYALASAGEFLGWRAANPVPVLYVDGEMPGAALRERLARIVASNDSEAPAGFLRFVTPDLQPDGVMPNLAEQAGQAAIDAVLNDARVIVIDNLSCLVRVPKENDADGWLPVAEWALRMRATGRSVLFVHHSGKNGQQRGTSKREDLLDTVIGLRRPADYRAEEGARFEVHFEKARALFGQDVTPFEAALETDRDGKQTWTTKTVEGAAVAQMIELSEMGLSLGDIGKELGLNKSTVMRQLRKAEEEGRYKPKPKKPKAGNVVEFPRGGRNDD